MEGNHLSCSFYGCKRTYTNSESLNNHQKDHHKIPAQTFPGKSFLCSSIGCEGSFSSMQQLMDHMRHHHKPNYFFLCESCRAKLRSYRTLLKHLQTCAKVAKKASKIEPGAVPDMDSSGIPLASMDMEPSGPLMASEQMDARPRMPSNTAAVPHPSQQVPANVATTRPEVSIPALEMTKTPNVLSQTDASYSSFPPNLSPVHLADPSHSEQQQWIPRIGPSNMATSSPQTPPGSNAVWRKNQDPPAPLLHRWNSSTGSQAQALSRVEFKASHSAVVSFGSTPGGATAAFSVGTAPQTAKR